MGGDGGAAGALGGRKRRGDADRPLHRPAADHMRALRRAALPQQDPGTAPWPGPRYAAAHVLQFHRACVAV